MLALLQLIGVAIGLIYQTIAVLVDRHHSPPGQLVQVQGRDRHLVLRGDRAVGAPVIVLDHSLGGVEGYFLLDALAELGQICISDRAGYGWSAQSTQRRTSAAIVEELDAMLSVAGIAPPYVLVGDSFGSYNMRLYAHRFPEKVVGLVLTDGLHESGMMQMGPMLRVVQAVFLSGFVMAIAGAACGVIRLLRALGLFYWCKPGLRHFSAGAFAAATRSFCLPQHWWTMLQELWWMDESGRQLAGANDLGDLPIVDIKAASFFVPSWWTRIIPLGQMNVLRDRMQDRLMQLSTQTHQMDAAESGHFVWIDQPEVMVAAVKWVLARV